MELGSIVGYFGNRLTMIGRMALNQKFRPSRQTLNITAMKWARTNIFMGLLVSIPLVFMHRYQNKLEKDDYIDRAYRLRYNHKQTNFDRGITNPYTQLRIMISTLNS